MRLLGWIVAAVAICAGIGVNAFTGHGASASIVLTPAPDCSTFLAGHTSNSATLSLPLTNGRSVCDVQNGPTQTIRMDVTRSGSGVIVKLSR